MRRTLLPAAAVLLALTSCATHEEELRADLAAVTAEAPAEPGEQAQEEPLVPVEVTADLVDPEGSTVGTAVLRDTANGTELEVGVSGLTPGFHAMGVYAVGDCTAVRCPPATRRRPSPPPVRWSPPCPRSSCWTTASGR